MTSCRRQKPFNDIKNDTVRFVKRDMAFVPFVHQILGRRKRIPQRTRIRKGHVGLLKHPTISAPTYLSHMDGHSAPNGIFFMRLRFKDILANVILFIAVLFIAVCCAAICEAPMDILYKIIAFSTIFATVGVGSVLLYLINHDKK